MVVTGVAVVVDVGVVVVVVVLVVVLASSTSSSALSAALEGFSDPFMIINSGGGFRKSNTSGLTQHLRLARQIFGIFKTASQ